MEAGESSEECLAREIHEELNLQAVIGSPIDTYLFEVIPSKRVFIATYRCAMAGPYTPALSDEHKRIGLFPLHALPGNLPGGYRRSIESAIAHACGSMPRQRPFSRCYAPAVGRVEHFGDEDVQKSRIDRAGISSRFSFHDGQVTHGA
ncbi:NUDIX domain-containing protein [Achromobacter xylosoxidans]